MPFKLLTFAVFDGFTRRFHGSFLPDFSRQHFDFGLPDRFVGLPRPNRGTGVVFHDRRQW